MAFPQILIVAERVFRMHGHQISTVDSRFSTYTLYKCKFCKIEVSTEIYYNSLRIVYGTINNPWDYYVTLPLNDVDRFQPHFDPKMLCSRLENFL